MRSMAGAAVLTIIGLAGCGGSSNQADAAAGPDAAGSDAAAIDARHLADAPLCPEFLSATPEWHDDFVSDAEAPLFYVAARVFRGTDNTGNLFIVVYDPAMVQLGVDFDPVFETAPAHLELFYDINAKLSPQKAFASISGTLNLTTACPVGVSGTITDGAFAEVTLGSDQLADTRIPGGCSVTVPGTLAFTIGAACP